MKRDDASVSDLTAQQNIMLCHALCRAAEQPPAILRDMRRALVKEIRAVNRATSRSSLAMLSTSQ